jgi:putative oxidoreductase
LDPLVETFITCGMMAGERDEPAMSVRHGGHRMNGDIGGRDMSVAKLAARAVIGGLFVGHGTQKLLGWFGGSGMEGTEAMMRSLSMHPTRRNALAAGATETTAGALLLLGLATPLASAGLIGVMTTAIRKVHLPNGPWVANGGWEYNAVLVAALTLIAEEGPGPVSLDRLLGTERSGLAWGLGALALGVAASTATIEMAHRSAPPAPDDDATSGPNTAGDPASSS